MFYFQGLEKGPSKILSNLWGLCRAELNAQVYQEARKGPLVLNFNSFNRFAMDFEHQVANINRNELKMGIVPFVNCLMT